MRNPTIQYVISGWGLDVDEWETEQWRRGCRLLAAGRVHPVDRGGFHPAGAVIDEKHVVQHIFIYSGHPNGPAGVFRITRSVDTPKLTAFLNENP